MSTTEAPYGKWPSPISVDLLTGSAISISDFKANGTNDLFFLESRPFEGGRTALVKMDGDGKMTDVVGKDVNCRTRVHEYGGCAFTVGSSGLVYSNFGDNRLYYAKDLATPLNVEPITPADQPLRFANFEFHPTEALLVAVCEDHTKSAPADVKNYLVTIDLKTREMQTLVKGADFYSNPIFSPDGSKLLWKEWMHPEMPWTNSVLYVADFNGSVSNIIKIAGGTKAHRCAVTQPRFVQDGVLVYSCDTTGYQQLYKASAPYTEPSMITEPVKGDFAGNDWVFGNASFTAVPKTEEIIATYTSDKGLTLLASINLKTGKLESIKHPFLTIDGIEANPSFPELLYITGSTRQSKGLFSFYAKNGDLKVLKSSIPSETSVDEAFMSLAIPMEIPITKTRSTYGFYYPPTSPSHTGPSDSAGPPLLMRIHGGPTSFAPPATSLQISYWTSRGYAFFNLNYGGSSGFGRAYMASLDSNWGIVDTEDAIAAAQYLSANDFCDGSKMAIDGGSAGGYTVLNTLCHQHSSSTSSASSSSPVFAAGCSLYGVSELTALALDTHKFESQYLFNLVGGTPDEVPDRYRDRSPLYHAAQIRAPIMVQQGTDDKVVPINQAQDMVDVIEKNGGTVELLIFKGEGHGFRGAAAQRASLEGETRFFEKYLKL